jgi:glycosyltransferase involved in cell wall biosynthesis
MACRTPVIGTPVGAAPDLLLDGQGILVRPEDPEDMAHAILTVCRMSAAEWRRLSDQAYAVARQYTWDDASRRFESALREAARTGTKK